MVADLRSHIPLHKHSLEKLIKHMVAESYQGYDPYDTLMSPLFKYPPFNSRFVRFGFQQVGKRIPVSMRRPLLIKKGLNPVTIGLSIQAYAYLLKVMPTKSKKFKQEIEWLMDQLVKLRSKGYSGSCWGYNFDWEARYTRIDAFVPTSVATGIITNGLFEYYLITGDNTALDICRDACLFITKDLNKSFEGDSFCYSYSPVDHQFVLNASMKAARLLAQVYSIDSDERFLSEARKAVKYVVQNQKEDGSWAYSNHDPRTWSDNYHTGYILDCLYCYIHNTADEQFRVSLDKGYNFYKNHFFKDQRIPKFYSNKTYPIDSTAAAQSILTLCRFGDVKWAGQVAEWHIRNMQSPNGGFYFRKHRYYTDRQIFMRWSNAWMLMALAYFLNKKRELDENS